MVAEPPAAAPATTDLPLAGGPPAAIRLTFGTCSTIPRCDRSHDEGKQPMANTDVVGFWKVAEADPDHLAVVDPDYNEMTYGELAALTNQIVHGLRALGLQKGD